MEGEGGWVENVKEIYPNLSGVLVHTQKLITENMYHNEQHLANVL